MSSNLQPPISSNSQLPPLPEDPNQSADVSGTDTAKTKKPHAVIVDGKLVIVDTTSSAAGSVQGSLQTAAPDAGKPQLSFLSNDLTSAQMYAMGVTAMNKARRQEIESQAAKYKLTLLLKMGTVTTTVPLHDIFKKPLTNPETDTTTGTNSPIASTGNQARQVADAKDAVVAIASNNPQGTTSSSTSSTTSNQTNSIVSGNRTVTIQTLEASTSQLVTLETTLSTALSNAAKKQFLIANPLATPEQLVAFENAIKQITNGYVRLMLTAGNINSFGPSELFLKVPGINALNLDSTAANAAAAVGFAEYVMGLVESGDIEKFAQTYIFPNDSTSASKFAANAGAILLDVSLEQVGGALNMQGLGQQVESQAKSVRDENKVLGNPIDISSIIKSLAMNTAPTSGLSASEIEAKALKAVDNTNSQAPFYTRSDLLSSLTASFEAEFPDNKQLAGQLASQFELSVMDDAMGKQKFPFPPLPVNPGNIDVVALQSSIINTMVSNFIKSDQEVREAKKQADAIKAISDDIAHKKYIHELAVRDDIKTQLIEKLDLKSDQAAYLAAHADLGIKHTGPLYAQGSTQVLPPEDFRLNLKIGYQANVHASPELDFGQAIEHVAGVTTGFDHTNMIGLINESYYKGGSENRSYLDLPPSEQLKVQQQRLYDPGAQLVLSWGSIINGISGPNPDKPPALSIPI